MHFKEIISALRSKLVDRKQILVEKMNAVVIHGPGDYRYEQMDKPRAGKEEIVVKVHKAGVCAADPKLFHGVGYFRTRIPVVSGHEFIGEVVELGEGAKEKFGVDTGDSAIAEQIVPCWECYYCKRGLYNLCVPHHVFGVLGPDGGWAEYVKYPSKSIVHKVPRRIPWKAAAGIEPLACAIHGVERGNIALGDTVAIFGAGAIGLYMLQAARLKQPRQLILIDNHDYRLAIGKELGADVTINAAKEDTAAKVRELTDGIGADVVLEAAGTKAVPELAVDIARKRGRFVVFGVYGEKAGLDWSIISDIKELEIVGGHLGLNTYPVAIRLLDQGLVKTDKINTHDLALKDFRRALEISEKKIDNAIKVLLTP
ncbi:alcohol dehydrogenase catalytic domain-containing protein [[Eubacterium] cellulosolvens]